MSTTPAEVKPICDVCSKGASIGCVSLSFAPIAVNLCTVCCMQDAAPLWAVQAFLLLVGGKVGCGDEFLEVYTFKDDKYVQVKKL